MDNELSKTFLGKIPETLKDTLFSMNKLKSKLKKQVAECFYEVGQDLAIFNGSI
jgi:hypothetical protein